MSYGDGATAWQRYDVEQAAITEHEATLAAAHGTLDETSRDVFTPEARRALENGLRAHYAQRFEFGVQVRRLGDYVFTLAGMFTGRKPSTTIGSEVLP